ncbi:periplasmic binding protein/LacI transcriptional regulator, putative [Candidatus Vecturithrix granuli]|uniref:Periplasmic binding protein/LacI transcriptional regulator, putative n=1 Tax=Vecturithrix granuli TaxID=1499967 RepID=A0A081C8E4_VECG1|nr:periplasmic binding protein/LacI transcriptional regulator, putative [Candidatus Vecturithrix granuli]
MKKICMCVLVFMFSLSVTLAYAEGELYMGDKDKTYVIAFSQDDMNNDWRASQVNSAKKEAEKYKNVKFIYTDAQGSSMKQVNDIEDLIAQGVDAILTSPREQKPLTPVVAKAYQEGIPIILLDRRVDGDQYTAWIGPDNVPIAKAAAEYMGKQLNGKGKIIHLQGVPGSTPQIERSDYFIEVLKEKYPDIEIVAQQPADFLRQKALEVMENLLQAHPDINGLYSESDSMAYGAMLAFKNAGIDMAPLVVVGIDYITQAKEMIKAGLMDATFTFDTCGKEGVQALDKLFKGETIPKDQVVPSTMVTIENVDSVEPIF